MEETSLDQFAAGDEGEEAGAEAATPERAEAVEGEPAEDGEAAADQSGSDDADDDRPVERSSEGPAPTLSFTPTGAPCAECGRSVRRRWHTDAGPLCEDCRAW